MMPNRSNRSQIQFAPSRSLHSQSFSSFSPNLNLHRNAENRKVESDMEYRSLASQRGPHLRIVNVLSRSQSSVFAFRAVFHTPSPFFYSFVLVVLLASSKIAKMVDVFLVRKCVLRGKLEKTGRGPGISPRIRKCKWKLKGREIHILEHIPGYWVIPRKCLIEWY